MQIQFFNELGDTLVSGAMLDMVLEGEEGVYNSFELVMSVSPEVFDSIDGNHYFNFTTAARMEEVTFRKDAPIELALRLDENLVQLVETFGDSSQEILDRLFDDPTDEIFITIFQVKNWYLLKAVQEEELPEALRENGASLRKGLRTMWSLSEEDKLMHASQRGRGAMKDTVLGFFEEQGIGIEKIPGKGFYKGTVKGENGVWDFYTVIDEELSRCVFYSVFPYLAEKSRLQAAMEFVTRANDGLPVGNFELDLADGEIKFKTAIEVQGDRLSYVLFEQVAAANIENMDRYYKGLMEVLLDNAEPMTAIESIEG